MMAIDHHANAVRTSDGRLAEKACAVVEVCLVTLLTVCIYKALKTVEPLGFNCSPGITMIVAATLMILLRRRDFATYGVVANRWRFGVNMGAAISLVLLLDGLAEVALLGTGMSTPLSMPTSAVLGAAALRIPTVLISFLIATRPASRQALERTPVIGTILLLVALGLAAPGLAIYRGAPAWQVAGLVTSLTFCTALGEELFFRGYVQSRLNNVFGRPWQLFGVPIGPGLLIASLLFGSIHVLNPTRPFEGHWEFSWSWGAIGVLGGLLYGFLRELTGSIWAGTIVHGLSGVYRGIAQVFLSR
jgi:membrane protease YdiL (CAAX protease family)